MKKAMVYGAGVSGLAACELLRKNGYEVILVDDKKGLSSKEAMTQLNGIELFIKSPGIPYNELVLEVKNKEIELIDEIELAYRYSVGKFKIIAVTGTNGKTTTTSKIAGLLEADGYKVEAGGNIGKAFAQIVLEEKQLDFVVLELSSYQLENLKQFKADLSLVINLSPDHMDRYKKETDYYLAKFNVKNNADSNSYFILNIDSKESLDLYKKGNEKLIKVSSLGDKAADFYVENGILKSKDEEILEADKLSLKGKHNLENVMFMVATAKTFGLSNEIIREYLYNTESLEHRMENFLEVDGVTFVNDSKGTNIDSTVKAMEAYKTKPILICGGKNKYVDLVPLAKAIKENAKLLYLIGDTADMIEKLVKEEDYPVEKIFNLKNLENVINEIKLERGDIVLFSPAHSSFDQFANYVERGRIFKELVNKKFKK